MTTADWVRRDCWLSGILIQEQIYSPASPSRISFSSFSRSFTRYTSFGLVKLDCEKIILFPGRVCNPDAAPVCVMATGILNLGARIGWVVEADGVVGTGMVKTFTRAASPAKM